MWRSLLKKNQENFIVPPGFKKLKIATLNNKAIYDWEFQQPFKEWTIVDSNGKAVRTAEKFEIFEQFKRYPKVHCFFLKIVDSHWIVVYNQNLYKLQGVPETAVSVKSFSPLIARRYGGVLIFDSFNFRNMQPWNVDQALLSLNRKELDDVIPNYLEKDQKFAYTLLLQEEKAKRIPPTEKRIKDILSKENASLIRLNQRRDGYSIEFHYEGRRRNVVVKEDLVLVDAGMCLDGMDKYFSLDSFLSILKDSGK